MRGPGNEQEGQGGGRRRTGRATARVLLPLVFVLSAAVGAAAADDPEVRPVFEAVRTAWEHEDQQALAALTHRDGLRVMGPHATQRASTYSPSQAFYYFQNLFQSYDTDAFLYERVQDGSDGPRVHALARWHRHRAGTHREETVRLMFVLARDGDGWGLAEITTIR